jgi:hypothetical protein
MEDRVARRRRTVGKNGRHAGVTDVRSPATDDYSMQQCRRDARGRGRAQTMGDDYRFALASVFEVIVRTALAGSPWEEGRADLTRMFRADGVGRYLELTMLSEVEGVCLSGSSNCRPEPIRRREKMSEERPKTSMMMRRMMMMMMMQQLRCNQCATGSGWDYFGDCVFVR